MKFNTYDKRMSMSFPKLPLWMVFRPRHNPADQIEKFSTCRRAERKRWQRGSPHPREVRSPEVLWGNGFQECCCELRQLLERKVRRTQVSETKRLRHWREGAEEKRRKSKSPHPVWQSDRVSLQNEMSSSLKNNHQWCQNKSYNRGPKSLIQGGSLQKCTKS